MPRCETHGSDRNISCRTCYTDEELQAEVQKLQEIRLPSAPGLKKQPRRGDAEPKAKRRSWLDDMLE